jgi:hypothetical protein
MKLQIKHQDAPNKKAAVRKQRLFTEDTATLVSVSVVD